MNPTTTTADEELCLSSSFGQKIKAKVYFPDRKSLEQARVLIREWKKTLPKENHTPEQLKEKGQKNSDDHNLHGLPPTNASMIPV